MVQKITQYRTHLPAYLFCGPVSDLDAARRSRASAPPQAVGLAADGLGGGRPGSGCSGVRPAGICHPERLNGLYGPHNWKLGLTLAMLSPMVWEYVSRNGAKWQLAVAWLATAAVVLLASNRESWIVFALAMVIWLWLHARRLGFHPIKLLMLAALATALAGGVAYQANPKFAQRVDQSTAVLDFSYEGLNRASSLRMYLWRNAAIVLENHPINGAGVRSCRYAYTQ